MNLWRINLKPGASDGIDSRIFCIERNIVGVGWRVGDEENMDWETYIKIGTADYYNEGYNGWWPAINAIGDRIKNDDLIWTRDWQGIYYLGRILGDWYYCAKPENIQSDIINIRPCKWTKIGTVESVPGKLVNSFIPARTVQQVNDEGVNLFSRIIYNRLNTEYNYSIEKYNKDNIFSLLSSDDCEDVIALYLQKEMNYLIVPSSCKYDTMNYEYVLIDKNTGVKAVVQVKNGNVDLSFENYKDIDSIIYLFTTEGNIFGDQKENMKILRPKEIKDFIFNNTKILPQKIKEWVNFVIIN